jgi:hypothetical protein
VNKVQVRSTKAIVDERRLIAGVGAAAGPWSFECWSLGSGTMRGQAESEVLYDMGIPGSMEAKDSS